MSVETLNFSVGGMKDHALNPFEKGLASIIVCGVLGNFLRIQLVQFLQRRIIPISPVLGDPHAVNNHAVFLRETRNNRGRKVFEFRGVDLEPQGAA